MKSKFLFVVAAAGALLAACGSNGSTPADVQPAPPPTSAAPAAAPAAPATAAPAASASVAKTAETSLGKIVADAEGHTLYGFTQDSSGSSTCNEGCAGAWPPLTVSGDIAVDGLDKSLFTVIDRADGTKQLKMGKWPLYRFSGDAGPGDTNGQGSGGSWFVIGVDGKLIKG